MPGPRGEECRLCYYGESVPQYDKLAECRAIPPNDDGEWPQIDRSRWCSAFNPHPEKAEWVWIGGINGRDEVEELKQD
jgi:hypothetical protein